jgi:hypothetical protein
VRPSGRRARDFERRTARLIKRGILLRELAADMAPSEITEDGAVVLGARQLVGYLARWGDDGPWGRYNSRHEAMRGLEQQRPDMPQLCRCRDGQLGYGTNYTPFFVDTDGDEWCTDCAREAEEGKITTSKEYPWSGECYPGADCDHAQCCNCGKCSCPEGEEDEEYHGDGS